MSKVRSTRVYIAGPITIGDQALNIRNGIDAADAVRGLGYAPFCPHLTHFWHMIHPHTSEGWLMLDFEWLALCDAMLRLPGESKGADREAAYARSLGIPVVFSVDELERMVPTEQREREPVSRAAGAAGEMTASEAEAVAQAYGPVASVATCDCPDCQAARNTRDKSRLDRYSARLKELAKELDAERCAIKNLNGEIRNLRDAVAKASEDGRLIGFNQGVADGERERAAQAATIAKLSAQIIALDPNSSGLDLTLVGKVAANSIGKVGVIVGVREYPAGWTFIGVNVDDGREWSSRTPAIVADDLGAFIARRERVAHIKGTEGREL